ncbi:MAG: exosortase H [Euryarchaeota archaeon]|nr:exosortase H [Euryarchaeota archaeon]
MVKAKGTKKDKRRSESKSKKVGPRDTSQIAVRKDIVSTVVEKAKENIEALKYVAFFLAFCFVFYLVYYFLTLRGSLSILKNLTASILGALFSICGADVVIQGATISINGFGLEIIDECTAVFSSIVYCSAVLAYPATAKNKGVGIAFGVPSLYAINIFRLSVLALVGIYHPDMFEFVHVYLWQASFIIFVVVIFLLWLRLVVK